MSYPDEYRPRATVVRASLLEVKTIAGVEDRLAILNATFALAIVMGLGLWPYLMIALLLHLLAARLTRRDPYLRRIYVRFAQQGDRYDPWPRVAPKRARRPPGFGRTLLC
ncbi:MAG: VirB3 family type IV secretion system protein [Proteobacteria bacterium]|nr:VirB3 family type IV secretion system protein [Burkholderiales bacterium]